MFLTLISCAEKSRTMHTKSFKRSNIFGRTRISNLASNKIFIIKSKKASFLYMYVFLDSVEEK